MLDFGSIDEFALDDAGDADPLAVTIAHTLVFTDSFLADTLIDHMVQTLNLTSSMSAITYKLASLAQAMSFSDSFVALLIYKISQSLVLTSQFKTVVLASLTEVMALISTPDAEVVTPDEDVLAMVQVMECAGSTYHTPFSDTIVFQDIFVAWTSRQSSCLGYDADLGSRDGMRLTWPYVSPTLTVNLRNPKFGNTAVLDTNVATLRNRSGELKQVNGFPTAEIFSFAFEALSEALKDELVAFLIASAADEIGLLDHEDRQWRGVIVSPVNTIVTAGRLCMFEASFEFRGTLV